MHLQSRYIRYGTGRRENKHANTLSSRSAAMVTMVASWGSVLVQPSHTDLQQVLFIDTIVWNVIPQAEALMREEFVPSNSAFSAFYLTSKWGLQWERLRQNYNGIIHDTIHDKYDKFNPQTCSPRNLRHQTVPNIPNLSAKQTQWLHPLRTPRATLFDPLLSIPPPEHHLSIEYC